MRKIKLAIVRGDFSSVWEMQNFEKLPNSIEKTLFTGFFPVADLKQISRIQIRKLFSPVDFNFGKINKWIMFFLNRVFTDAHVLFGLKNEIKGFDIAHCAETYFSFTQQCIQAKKEKKIKKIVCTVWENIPFNNEKIHGRKEYKENSFENIDLFLAVTKKAKKALVLEGCPFQKIEILTPGIDINKFKPSEKFFKKIPKDNKINMLFVGRLEKEKGIDFLLKIFNSNSFINSHARLVVVGSGTYQKYLAKSINNKNILFLGSVNYEKMPTIYNSCDILVHPAIGNRTWGEQLGMVLIEAMACGKPIVTINSGSISEVVGNAGIVTDIENFEKSIVSVIKSKKIIRKMSRLARQCAVQKYDSAKYAKNLIGIYKKLMK